MNGLHPFILIAFLRAPKIEMKSLKIARFGFDPLFQIICQCGYSSIQTSMLGLASDAIRARVRGVIPENPDGTITERESLS
jgi:hypothetical protein